MLWNWSRTVLRLAPCSSSLPVPSAVAWNAQGVVENTESHRGLVEAASFLDGRSNLGNSWKRWPLKLRAGMVKNIQGEGNYACEGIWVRASGGKGKGDREEMLSECAERQQKLRRV